MTGGTNLEENYVGSHFENYDYYVVLSHFKGHSMAGYGGAIKNISIGIASSEGKAHIHSGGTGGSMWGGDQDAFLESMAEDGASLVERIESRNGLHTLEYAEDIGLGSRTYELINIDN